jgi:hypothetical protein
MSTLCICGAFIALLPVSGAARCHINALRSEHQQVHAGDVCRGGSSAGHERSARRSASLYQSSSIFQQFLLSVALFKPLPRLAEDRMLHTTSRAVESTSIASSMSALSPGDLSIIIPSLVRSLLEISCSFCKSLARKERVEIFADWSEAQFTACSRLTLRVYEFHSLRRLRYHSE